MKADRLALLKIREETWADENNWWNKMKTLSDNDIDLMPYSFVKKYGAFLLQFRDFQRMQHTDESRDKNNRWDVVRSIYKLKTDNEKAEDQAFIQESIDQPENITEGEYELTEYMKRQPRNDLRK